MQQEQDVAATLRRIAAWLESHPEIEPFDVNFFDANYGLGPVRVNVYGLDGDGMAEVVRKVGGRWEKGGDDDQFTLTQEIAPGVMLRLAAGRSRVCERVVTGKAKKLVPNPDAPMVLREVETVEWRCPPLLERVEATS